MKKLKISTREHQVLQMLLNEMKGHEIAKALKLDEKTIGTYKKRLLLKVGAKTIVGLYLWNKVNKAVVVEESTFEKSELVISKRVL